MESIKPGCLAPGSHYPSSPPHSLLTRPSAGRCSQCWCSPSRCTACQGMADSEMRKCIPGTGHWDPLPPLPHTPHPSNSSSALTNHRSISPSRRPISCSTSCPWCRRGSSMWHPGRCTRCHTFPSRQGPRPCSRCGRRGSLPQCKWRQRRHSQMGTSPSTFLLWKNWQKRGAVRRPVNH